MRVLALPRYERLGASSRLRFYQYFPFLEDVAKIEIKSEPLLSNAYVQALYQPNSRKDRAAILRAYANRLSLVRRAHRQYDLVWVEKELFPYLPAWGERSLNQSGIPYVVDYDDATFHQYDSHRRPQIRRLLGGKIAEVMRRAAAVVAGNSYLRDYARASGAANVEYIPTAVDLERYPAAKPGSDDRFTVGWIGTPLTAVYLNTVRAPLEQLGRDNRSDLRLVGAGPIDWLGADRHSFPWSEETEVSEIRQFSVGIMPLPDAPFERGKCGYKLIQCMACAVPVVASPVGVNSTLIHDGKNGFLAGSEKDWLRALERLRDDIGFRRRMGTEARQTVEAEFCTVVTAPKLAAVLGAAAGIPARR